MVSTLGRIQIGQFFSNKKNSRKVVVTGFGMSQGDETTIQVTDISEERWGGEFSVSIFQDQFTGPLPAQVG
ncbi:MAG: hypothetical protein Q8P55_01195 [bacterium]|nr:hypothetical protein [bacterium]